MGKIWYNYFNKIKNYEYIGAPMTFDFEKGRQTMKTKYLKRFPIGNPHRAWKQDKFILSTFSPTCVFYNKFKDNPDAYEIARKSVKTCADAGFNLVEMGWATPAASEAALPACEALGLDIIYQNLAICGGMQNRIGFDENPEPRKDIQKIVSDLKKYRHVIGYYIWDEPYMPDQLAEARRQMDMFQDYDPSALLFTVAIPSYNKEYKWRNGLFPVYLRDFIEKLDPAVLSLDYYPVGMKEHDETRQCDESLMWCDLGLMKKLSAEYNMPMWFYYQGQNLHNVDFFVFPMVRMFMHAGILYGAKGLQHYTAAGAVVEEFTGEHGIFFEEQKQIHAEIRELGNTLMALDCKRVFHDASLLPGSTYTEGLHNDISESEHLLGELPYRVSASESEDEYGNKYLTVLNRDYIEAKKFTLELKADSRIYEVSKKDGVHYVVAESTKQIEVELQPGDMVLYRIQPADEEAFNIDYVLEK